jgi:hypothetical protein
MAESQSFLKGTHCEAFIAKHMDTDTTTKFVPPLGMDQVERGTGVGIHGKVSLQSLMAWQNMSSDFHHQIGIGEDWLYDYNMKIKFRDVGVWDRRTPILHPAVAAVDATQAGYDDAYIRAMQNVDVLIGVNRDDTKLPMRQLVSKYSRLPYHPFRVLVRGAVLWALCAMRERSPDDMTQYKMDGTHQPLRIGDIAAYSLIARKQANTASDVLYVRCEAPSDLHMVEVMRAICNERCPIETRHTLAKVWPGLTNPYVIYTGTASIEMGIGAFDASQVENTMHRFCDTFDCHDLMAEALAAVQFFLCRPAGAGVLAGTNSVVWGLPRADMRVGAIGPLLAGVSTEGMRTLPFDFPTIQHYAYGAAVRACFISASYFEALLKFDDTHPVARGASAYARAGKYRLLCAIDSASGFMEKHVRPVAAQAGWDCLTRALTACCPQDRRDFLGTVCNPERVPWWTNVACHLVASGASFLATWAKPAIVQGYPVANRWYTYKALGGVTRVQLASAMRWLNAEVMYCSDTRLSQRRWHKVKPGSRNRFLPNLTPTVKLGQEIIATACVRFKDGINGGMVFLNSLANADSYLVKTVGEFELPDAFATLDSYMPGPAHPFESPVIEPEPPVLQEGDGPEPHPTDAGISDPTPPADDIDWDVVADNLGQLGLAVDGQLMVEALFSLPRQSQRLREAAHAFEETDIKASALGLPLPQRETVLKAYLLSAARIMPHATTLQNNTITARMADMSGLLRQTMDDQRPKVSWADEVEAEMAAERILAAATAEHAAASVPAARDDPVGESEIVSVFGRRGSVSPLEDPPPIAADATPQFPMETIGFSAPPGSSD